MTAPIAAMGATAALYLYIWLASIIAASEVASRKGYSERLGRGSGLFLAPIAVLIWLCVPARPESWWAERRDRRRTQQIT